MKNKFPLIKVSGTPKQIGLQTGKILKDRIKKTIKVYKGIFKLPEKEVFRLARFFKNKIKNYNKDYATEIEAIAKGSGVNPLWIYALNSRSEIMASSSNECTVACFRKTGILGQNWDFSMYMEKLAVLLEITKQDKTKIFMMTEPGIIGKIGFNSNGIGTALAALLNPKEKPFGVPIHIILRAVLDSKNLKQAKQKIEKGRGGIIGSIIVADKKNAFCKEFAGKDTFTINIKDVFVRTNNYLKKSINKREGYVINSFVRYERGQQILKTIKRYSKNEMKKIFLDKENGKYSINRTYKKSALFGLAGTVCTIVMDLNKLEFSIIPGNPRKTKSTRTYKLINNKIIRGK